MPRVRNEAACTTCTKRKVKCDERLPVCQNCIRAKRYCDHTRKIRFRHEHPLPPKQNDSEITLEPRDALKDPTTARLFAHYIAELAAWYDLSDGAMHFTKQIPQAAMSRPLLFYAVIAFAAIHLSVTTAPSLRPVAERHQAQCIQHLLRLGSADIQADEGHHLAAVCTLRSYEVLAEDFDPNRHLSGAYALSAAASLTPDSPTLWKAGFFNYLREDITFSLMNRRVLKINLGNMEIPEMAVDDEDQLNIAALHLAAAVNSCFGGPSSAEALLLQTQARFYQWTTSLSAQFTPFYDSTDQNQHDGAVFPTIRLLSDCHVAVAQYMLVRNALLSESAYAPTHIDEPDRLATNAARVCGMAFTSNSPAVLVNSFGPISYCGRFIRDRSLQTDLVRRLHGCRRDTGWPVQRIIDDLEQYWSEVQWTG